MPGIHRGRATDQPGAGPGRVGRAARRRSDRGSDRGSGVALVLLVVALGGFLILVTVSLAQVILDRHRAGMAADLAALAAASSAHPCEQARLLARANQAELRWCRIQVDGSVDVGVRVPSRGAIGRLVAAASGEARAGPEQRSGTG